MSQDYLCSLNTNAQWTANDLRYRLPTKRTPSTILDSSEACNARPAAVHRIRSKTIVDHTVEQPHFPMPPDADLTEKHPSLQTIRIKRGREE